ncbi:MAG: hypothetical protein CVT66_06295 [Actinobacteria bacterium HGW-Actinobacteria-6]|nr:MAG: hypothetical protein CVT66_06295 [Actinobacteria bacterium HGW-Actinobacteria-6]
MAELQLTSWLGGTALGKIPVVAGSWKVTNQAGVQVPGTIEFSVPAVPEWIPTTDRHPLAAMGQRVWAQVDQGDGLRTWGWFRLNRPKLSGPVVQCSGVGLLREVERFRFPTSMQVAVGTSRSQLVRDLLAGIMPVVISGVADSATSALITWEESRISALWEVLESWPARGEVREQVLWVLPAWNDASPGDPTVSLVDGVGGSLVDLEPVVDDSDPYNGYVVSTVPSGEEAAVVRMWTMPDGPMAWGGPYGYNPGFHSSPLNPADPTKLLAIAESMTRREVSAGRTVTFIARPSLRAEVGQVARVRSTRKGVSGVGRITALELTRGALSGTVAMLS